MKTLDFNLAAAIARRNASTIHLAASAATEDNEPLREVTGEEIVAAIQAAGGHIERIVRDDDGLISELIGHVPPIELADYDPAEMSEVLESLHATGVTPTKLTGDLAQASVGSSIAFTGSTTTGSAVITSPSSMTGLAVGQPVSGTGIPANATLSLLSPLTISANATATGSGVALIADAEVQVLGLSEWTIDWKRKTVDTTTTDSATYESALPSTASWTVKSKHMFIDGDSSQATNILAALQTPTGALMWNFFPTIATGRAGFQGQAFIDGITLAAGVGKVVGLDVSLKGTGPLTQLAQTAPVISTTTTGLQAEE